MPSWFWCEALFSGVHRINHLPSQVLNNDSPFLRLFGKPPNYSTLHALGCVCYVHLQPQECTKLTTQYVKCAFLGYLAHQKGFLCYDPNLHRIQDSRNVIFLENAYFFAPNQDTHSSISKYVLPLFLNSSFCRRTNASTSLGLSKTSNCSTSPPGHSLIQYFNQNHPPYVAVLVIVNHQRSMVILNFYL